MILTDLSSAFNVASLTKKTKQSHSFNQILNLKSTKLINSTENICIEKYLLSRPNRKKYFVLHVCHNVAIFFLTKRLKNVYYILFLKI